MNDRVVRANWPDPAPGRARVEGAAAQVVVPLVDLCRAPNGARDRQLLLGDGLRVLERRAGWAFVQADKDGYVGYVPDGALGTAATPTHWVSAPATHIYPAPDFKQAERMMLSLGARLTVIGDSERFFETPQGFVPRDHLRKLADWDSDPVAVAARLLGTPYLWGGNSRSGIDCSGLVQAAMLACGVDCAGDSDMQEDGLGHEVTDGSGYRYGDLLFWKGHVGLVAGDTLLHANAGFMSTVHEPLEAAIRRIRDQGDGEVTRHRRV